MTKRGFAIPNRAIDSPCHAPAAGILSRIEFPLPLPQDQLDLDLCLFSGQVFRWRKAGDVYEGMDGPHRYRIDAHGQVCATADEEEFRRLFNLDCDLADVNTKLIQAAPELGSAITSLPGLRLMQPSDPTETFFCFLCTANNNLKRITSMVAKLADYGENGVFPSAERIAAIGEGELRAQGFGYRGATIPLAAREIMSRGGDDWLKQLKSADYRDAHRELVAIKGIGNKLADCICLYGLHHHEAVPIDTHLWQAACRVFFPHYKSKSLTDLRYREIGAFFRERFGRLAGWAHLYLYFGNMRARNTPV
jgi:N-glycosylase/DNA lyase